MFAASMAAERKRINEKKNYNIGGSNLSDGRADIAGAWRRNTKWTKGCHSRTGD